MKTLFTKTAKVKFYINNLYLMIFQLEIVGNRSQWSRSLIDLRTFHLRIDALVNRSLLQVGNLVWAPLVHLNQWILLIWIKSFTWIPSEEKEPNSNKLKRDLKPKLSKCKYNIFKLIGRKINYLTKRMK